MVFKPQSVSPQLAKSLGLEKAQGVVIAEVIPNSTASELGLQVNDVLLQGIKIFASVHVVV